MTCMASTSQHADMRTGGRDSQLHQLREFPKLLWDLPTELVGVEVAAQPPQNRALTTACMHQQAKEPQTRSAVASSSQHADVRTGKRDSQLYQAREVPKLLWDLPTQLVTVEVAAQHPTQSLDHIIHASAGSIL